MNQDLSSYKLRSLLPHDAFEWYLNRKFLCNLLYVDFVLSAFLPKTLFMLLMV
jgi:hypothetical protein